MPELRAWPRSGPVGLRSLRVAASGVSRRCSSRSRSRRSARRVPVWPTQRRVEGQCRVGVAGDGPTAFVHRVVVMRAQQCQIRSERRPPVPMVLDMVNVAPLPRPLAAHPIRIGEPAGPVPLDHRQPLRGAGMPPHIQPQGPPMEGDLAARDVGVTGDQPGRGPADPPSPVQLRSRGAGLTGQRLGGEEHRRPRLQPRHRRQVVLVGQRAAGQLHERVGVALFGRAPLLVRVSRAACLPDSRPAVRNNRCAASVPAAGSVARPATAAAQRSRSAVTCETTRVRVSTSTRNPASSSALRSRPARTPQAIANAAVPYSATAATIR